MNREKGRWIPLVIWIVAVFVLPNVLSLSGSGPDLPHRFDKVIHFVEYMVLALLFHWGLAQHSRSERALAFAAVVFACLAIGALDEFTQFFIPQRDSSIMDWLADAAGVIIGALLAVVRQSRATNKKEPT